MMPVTHIRVTVSLNHLSTATFAALVLGLTAILTDEALNMFEHLVGQMFKKSERKRWLPSVQTNSGRSGPGHMTSPPPLRVL